MLLNNNRPTCPEPQVIVKEKIIEVPVVIREPSSSSPLISERRADLAQSTGAETQFFPPCTGVYCGKKAPNLVPFRLAKVTQGQNKVEFVMAVESNPGDIVSDSLAVDGFWEPELVDVFAAILKEKTSKQRSCLFLDVGANLGVHAVYMARLGCRVIAFEMQPKLADLMRTSLYLNGLDDRVTLINQPVYDIPKTLYFVPIPGNLGGTNVYESRTGRSNEVAKEAVRIDDVVKERIDLMKIDVEGAEIHALRSMSNLFAKNLVGDIFIEIWGSYHEPVNFLFEQGFAPYRVRKDYTVALSRKELDDIMGWLRGINGYEEILFRKV